MFSYSAVQWIGRLCLLLPAHQIGTWYWQPSGSIWTFSQFIFFAILRLYQNCSNNESRKVSKEEVGRKITLNGSSRFRERGIREYKLRVNLSGVSGERFESPPPVWGTQTAIGGWQPAPQAIRGWGITRGQAEPKSRSIPYHYPYLSLSMISIEKDSFVKWGGGGAMMVKSFPFPSQPGRKIRQWWISVGIRQTSVFPIPKLKQTFLIPYILRSTVFKW